MLYTSTDYSLMIMSLNLIH